MARRRGPAGVQEQGIGTLGFPGNMGDPNTSLGPNAGMGGWLHSTGDKAGELRPSQEPGSREGSRTVLEPS